MTRPPISSVMPTLGCSTGTTGTKTTRSYNAAVGPMEEMFGG